MEQYWYHFITSAQKQINYCIGSLFRFFSLFLFMFVLYIRRGENERTRIKTVNFQLKQSLFSTKPNTMHVTHYNWMNEETRKTTHYFADERIFFFIFQNVICINFGREKKFTTTHTHIIRFKYNVSPIKVPIYISQI